MRRILLLGYFGAGNLGDDMLLADWLLANREWMLARELRADALSRESGPVAGFIESPNLAPLICGTLTQKQALRCNAGDYEALVAPGGSLLQDSTSLRSLLYYLWLIRRFASAGVPVYLLNQGLGPVHSWLGKALLPSVLARCRMVSLRDSASLELLLSFPQMARQPSPSLSCDPILAGRLSAEPPEGFKPPYKPGQYITAIFKGSTDEDARELAGLLGPLCEHSGLPVLFVPMHAEQDEPFCRLVASHLDYESTLLPVKELRSSCVSYNSAVLSSLAHSAFTISHRLHGLISAVAYGVPAAGIAYDPKVSAFCTEAGLPCLQPELLGSAESAAELVRDFEARAEIKANSEAKQSQLLERLRASETHFQTSFEGSN